MRGKMQPLPCARQAAGAAPAQLIPSFGVFDSPLTPHPSPLTPSPSPARGEGTVLRGTAPETISRACNGVQTLSPCGRGWLRSSRVRGATSMKIGAGDPCKAADNHHNGPDLLLSDPRSMTRKTPGELRSARWFAPDDFRSFGHRSRMKQMGYATQEFAGRPVIGIINTWSDFAQCHAHFKQRVGDVKRGVLQAGGFPVELPAISLSESTVKPTTMLYRNFLAMETEELIRSQPIDGVVLMGGCDKTTPGLILGATSAGVPAVYVPAGPMLRGNWHGQTLGSGSDAFKYWDERRAGKVSAKDWTEMQTGIARSYGVCMTMGTASTMTALADVIGLCLPGASSIPAADSNHIRMCSAAGRRVVDMVWEDLTPARILTQGAFRNA